MGISQHSPFDPEPNTDDLIAGFQDNDTWSTNSSDSNAFWVDELGGDGAYSAIADNGRTQYMSAQGAAIIRQNYDDDGNSESFSFVKPAEPSLLDFSFILDSNNDNIMYLPVKNNIWRNRNLDEIPVFTSGTGRATVNWKKLENSSTPDESIITPLGTSKFPIANRLYYGTDSGVVFRMDNANMDDQPAVDVTTGKGLPTGFINDINVDPSDADRVIITYSNYGLPSVFITENGGETWTDISGNLEESTDGTGNGPSVRSTAFHGGSKGKGGFPQRIFAATSTGLYYTFRLNGQNTVWRKENFAIANSVTDEVVTRKDGLVAVAAHGAGVFSVRFPIDKSSLPESTLSTAFLLDDFELLKNTQQTKEIDITGLFIQSQGLPIDIEMINSNPELVTVTLSGTMVKLAYTPDASGTASIGFIATSGEEQVSEGFTISILEPSIYEQTIIGPGRVPSQNFIDSNALAQAADDFTIPEKGIFGILRAY